MCDPETFGALGEWIGLTHEYGQATWSNLQWWISGSFAIILTSHFARSSLNIFTASLLGILYTLFSLAIYTNIGLDAYKEGLAVQDMRNFAEIQNCEITHLKPYEVPGLGSPVIPLLIFLVAMFLATIGYLGYSCRLNRKTATD